MKKYYIWLVMLFRAANPFIQKALEYYGDPENAYKKITGGDHRLLDNSQKSALSRITIKKAEEIIEFCEKNDYHIAVLSDKEYPYLLKEIYNPPVVIFYRGDLKCMRNKLCITAVGAREATPYSVKLCSKVCASLAEEDVVIVSGMARGIDSAAHRACTSKGRPTVGVLACGINYDYPKGSAELRESIVAGGGVYLTELLPGTGPSPEYFHARNRIMAGLSDGTAVFQAGLRSGSLITASYAVEEGRDVFCVPPPDVFDPRYAGVVHFLRDGATAIFNHDDILFLYYNYSNNCCDEDESNEDESGEDDEKREADSEDNAEEEAEESESSDEESKVSEDIEEDTEDTDIEEDTEDTDDEDNEDGEETDNDESE